MLHGLRGHVRAHDAAPGLVCRDRGGRCLVGSFPVGRSGRCAPSCISDGSADVAALWSLSSERKGLRLRRRGRCALPPAGFVSDPPVCAFQCACLGPPPRSPACTWRASVAAPSPGRWEGCVAQEQMSGVFQATHPSPCLSPRGASGTLAGRRTAAEGSFPHGPSSACHPEALGSCYQARLQGHLGWHRRSTAGGHGLGMRCSLAQGGPARVGVSSGCGAQLSSFLVLGVLLVSSRIGMSRVETSVSGRDRCRRSGEAHQGP